MSPRIGAPDREVCPDRDQIVTNGPQGGPELGGSEQRRARGHANPCEGGRIPAVGGCECKSGAPGPVRTTRMHDLWHVPDLRRATAEDVGQPWTVSGRRERTRPLCGAARRPPTGVGLSVSEVLADAQPRVDQAAHQHSAADGNSACGDDFVVHPFGHVVVVSFECPRGHPDVGCELVQLVMGVVRDEVGKDGSVCGPDGWVDENCHETKNSPLAVASSIGWQLTQGP